MAKKPEAKQTPEEIAEERIAEWKRDPLKPHPKFSDPGDFGAKTTWLNLGDLGLKAVPESLRTVHNLELLRFRVNEIKELPGWIGELSELKVFEFGMNHLRELPPEIGSLHKLVPCQHDSDRFLEPPGGWRMSPSKPL